MERAGPQALGLTQVLFSIERLQAIPDTSQAAQVPGWVAAPTTRTACNPFQAAR